MDSPVDTVEPFPMQLSHRFPLRQGQEPSKRESKWNGIPTYICIHVLQIKQCCIDINIHKGYLLSFPMFTHFMYSL